MDSIVAIRMSQWITLGCFIVITMFQSASCSVFNNTRLIADLLRDYQRLSRPGNNYSDPVKVNVEFDLLAIRDFVQLTNEFAITGVFELSWMDERMSWNPTDYGGIEKINIPQNMVWKPELINTKPFTAVQPIGIPTFGITYYYNGLAFWTPGDNYDTPCEADVTYYPFDSQICTFRFSDWSQIPGTIELVSTSSELGLGLYVINPMWDITNTVLRISHDEFGHFVYFGINFKRLYGFYVLNIILPICLISVVNIFVFFLPPESGERIGFSITVFLALSVLLTILSEHLPKASRPRISFICYLIFFQTTVSIFVLLATILSLRVYFTSDSENVPSHWQRFLQIANRFGNWSCRRGKKRQISSAKTVAKSTALSRKLGVVDVEDTLKSNSKTDIKQETEQSTESQTVTMSHTITWTQVGITFDKVCAVLFLVLNIFSITIYFLIMQANDKM